MRPVVADPTGAAWFSALSPSACRSGAVITYSGDFLVSSGATIIAAIESHPPETWTPGERRDRWLVDGVPLLARGDAWIVPLSWEPVRPEPPASAETLAARSNELWLAVRSDCDHRYGNGVTLDLDDEDRRVPFARALVAAGARRAIWWESGPIALVLVISRGGAVEDGTAMALYVVPTAWVSARRSGSRKKTTPTDVAWSWADAVAVRHDVGSVHRGAVLADGAAHIADAVQRLSDDDALPPLDAVPVVRRGMVSIVPLAWLPRVSPPGGPAAEQLQQRAVWLRQEVTSACTARYGAEHTIGLSSTGGAGEGYAAMLVRLGARQASWWSLGRSAVVLVVEGEPAPAPATHVALHIVPMAWVDGSAGTAVAPVDLAWNWSDVVRSMPAASPVAQPHDAASPRGESPAP